MGKGSKLASWGGSLENMERKKMKPGKPRTRKGLHVLEFKMFWVEQELDSLQETKGEMVQEMGM